MWLDEVCVGGANYASYSVKFDCRYTAYTFTTKAICRLVMCLRRSAIGCANLFGGIVKYNSVLGVSSRKVSSFMVNHFCVTTPWRDSGQAEYTLLKVERVSELHFSFVRASHYKNTPYTIYIYITALK